MGRVVPDGWEGLEVAAPSLRRELETLRQLATGLHADYTVYHAVHWTAVERGHAIFGEVDFIVVNRSGDLLMIEQKFGFLSETDDGLVKENPGKHRLVGVQMARSRDALLAKLRARPDMPRVEVDILLYCPHYRVKAPHAAGVAAERIVDATRRDELCRVIQEVLPSGIDTDTRAVHRFLSNMLQLEPDVSALVGRARTLVTRVSGGLATWARRLEMEPFRLRVLGTAGSGKTQLALAEFGAMIDSGRRPLYVCYNRPLADHIGRIAPAGGLVCTFHGMCEAVIRAHGEMPQFGGPGAFEALERRAAELEVPDELRFDAVLVDEGQDWIAGWAAMIWRHARTDARLWWLEDPLQNLYERAPVALPGWTTLHADSNFRSPRPIVRMLQRLNPAFESLRAESPLDLGEIEILTYTGPAELLQQVKMGIKACFSAGFKKADVVVLSYHGRDSSHLLRHDHLGDYTFSCFTGQYDLLQRPLYSSGDMLMESVLRFKGQSAPAVVFAEVDFAELDTKALRRLFVGATRASMKLVLVVSEPAAEAAFRNREAD